MATDTLLSQQNSPKGNATSLALGRFTYPLVFHSLPLTRSICSGTLISVAALYPIVSFPFELLGVTMEVSSVWMSAVSSSNWLMRFIRPRLL